MQKKISGVWQVAVEKLQTLQITSDRHGYVADTHTHTQKTCKAEVGFFEAKKIQSLLRVGVF